MSRQKKLTFFTASYSQISTVFPYVVVSPAYFAGTVQLGGLMQTASAFSSVQGSLSFFITAYRSLAEWRSVIERLAGFDRSVATARAAAATAPVIAIAPQDAAAMRIEDLAVRLPNGVPLVNARDVSFALHDRVLVTGPSGSGKSTLFRAIAGIWPFGSGTITVPQGAKVMMLPQRPYFPIGALSAAVIYPAEPGEIDISRVAEVLAAVGLPALVARMDEEAHWNRMLSLGEQQRLGVARALLHAPDYLFLDEATASLDEPAEAALYKLLSQRLKDSAVVSIGHRATLTAFHSRRLTLAADGEGHRLQEIDLQPAE
jgi:putative ATP-binding cassette transporter